MNHMGLRNNRLRFVTYEKILVTYETDEFEKQLVIENFNQFKYSRV